MMDLPEQQANHHFSGIDKALSTTSHISEILSCTGATSSVKTEIVVSNPKDSQAPASNAIVVQKSKKDLEDDYDTIRQNLQNAIDETKTAIDGLMSLALSSDQARPYEVLAQLLTTKMEASMRLLEMHERLHRMDENTQSSETRGPSTQINNQAIFVGNTSELLEMMKKAKKQFQDTVSNIEIRKPDRSDMV